MITKGAAAPHFSVKSHGEFQMKVKDVDTTKRTVDWVGNAYNYLDSDTDVLLPGCAAESIKAWGPDSNSVVKIKHAIGHDLTQLPGKIIHLAEGEQNIKGVNVKCLYGSTKMSDTTLGNDTLMNYLDEVYDNHSIGFQYQEYKFLERGHGNSENGKAFNEMIDQLINPEDAGKCNMILSVSKIKLYENSTVAFGANKMTPYLGSKNGTAESLALMLHNRMKKLQQTIRKGTQSDDMLQLIEVQFLQLQQLHDELFSDISVKNYLLENQKVKSKPEENIQKSLYSNGMISSIAKDFNLKD